MEGRPDIARNSPKGGKEDVIRFWRKIQVELNAAGPPMKSVADWKKVWTDQKKYVRRKASENNKASKGTGGGPNTQQAFSDIEQAIYDLVSLKDYVEGVEAKKIGLPTPKKPQIKKEAEEEFPEEYLDDVSGEENAELPPRAPTPPPQPPFDTPESSTIPKPRARVPRSAAVDALEAELSIQREQLQSISLAVNSIVEHHKIQKNHFKETESLKRAQLDEMRRHNSAMEEFFARLKFEYFHRNICRKRMYSITSN